MSPGMASGSLFRFSSKDQLSLVLSLLVGRHGTMPDTTSEKFNLIQLVIVPIWYCLEVVLVEAGGIELPI